MEKLMTAAEYLAHKYELPKEFPKLPLADENFISAWSAKENFAVLEFLSQEFKLPTEKFDWNNVAALKIEFKQTLGGRLPIISTANHDDFCQMVALLTAREAKKYPLTVNAFTIPCRAEKIYRHRVILLNAAPYSNISADKLSLTVQDWQEKSYQIRLRHESAHYGLLRTIAAFGEFSANRQRIFFQTDKRRRKMRRTIEFLLPKGFAGGITENLSSGGQVFR